MLNIKKQKIHKLVSFALGNLEAFTKRLKVMSTGSDTNKKKVVLSTKDLIVSRLPVGAKYRVEIDNVNGGFIVTPATPLDEKTKTISYRDYKNGKDLEPVLDIRHQANIQAALGDAEHIHVVFSVNKVTIRPVYSHEEIASEYPMGAQIEIGHPDEDGLYSQILKVIKVVRSEKLTTLSLETLPAFRESREFTILCVQLRRLGFIFDDLNSDIIIAKLPNAGAAMYTRHINLSDMDYAKPQRAVNERFNHKEPLASFVGCTAGVDVSAMESDGFQALNIIEYRPSEKRDYKKVINKKTGETTTSLVDKTDLGALSVAINSKSTKVIFNEDIYIFEPELVNNLIAKFNFLHVSIQCDDFSNVKSSSARETSIANLDTTCDMFIPTLDLIEKTEAPTFLLENVPGFLKSIECALLVKGLKWLGHNVSKEIIDAKNFDGMTNRSRAYLFATKLNSHFEFPKPIVRKAHAWNDVIAPRLSQLRDVSHCKSVTKGIETGRIRTIEPGDAVAPTILKSQNRQTKDSCYILMNGRYYMPSNEMIQLLMGIPEEFNVEPFSREIQTEILGQSIEYPMHKAVCASVKKHLLAYSRNIDDKVAKARDFTRNIIEKSNSVISAEPTQLALF